MAANIFVDIATPDEVAEGNVASLSEFFRQNFNQKHNESLHTEPAIILVEDDTMIIFSTKAGFMFRTATAEPAYAFWKKERLRDEIMDKGFGGDIGYISRSYRQDASPVVLALTTMFISFFGDGVDGMRKVISTISLGRFDYDQNRKGEYRFWYRKNGDWVRSSFCLFTDFLYNTTRSLMSREKSDEYLYNQLSKKGIEHAGYSFIAHATKLASRK